MSCVRKRLCVLAVALTVCMVMSVYSGTREQTIHVNTATLSSQTVTKTISCDGVVEAGEKMPIFTEVSCYIDKVVAQKGMFVSKGDVLAYINKEATKVGDQLSQCDALMLSAMSEEIRAPESGIVLKIDMEDGRWIEKSTACAVIAPSDSIRVRVAIREKHLPLLNAGLSVTVTGDALQNESYNGTLTDISSTAQSLEGGGTIVEGIVELSDAQEDPSLRLGVNVKAEIVVETVEEGVLVPYEAISETEESHRFVYVLSDGAAIRHVINDYDELSRGVLVTDKELLGKTVIMQPQVIMERKNTRYAATEDRS